MPRDLGTGDYNYPDGTRGNPGQTIFSARYNTFIDDLKGTLNQKLPLNKGGTGGDTPATARDNLDVEVAMQTVTDFDSHVWEAGSFKSGPGAINSPEGAGAAALLWIGDAQIFDNDRIIISARGTGSPTTYVRKKIGIPGVWQPWAIDNKDNFVLKAGDTMSGQLTVSYAHPMLAINKLLKSQETYLAGKAENLFRWIVALGDSVAESGANAGSNFNIRRYRDDGTPLLPHPLDINRATGETTLAGDLTIRKPQPIIYLDRTDINRADITGRNNGSKRWSVVVGNATPEAPPTNVGSDFFIQRYNDSGVVIDNPFFINRATGASTFTGSMTVNGSVIATSEITASYAFPVIKVNKAATGNEAYFWGTANGSNRWIICMGDNAAEGGVADGSNFNIRRYNNAGTAIAPYALNIDRGTGVSTFGGNVIVPGFTANSSSNTGAFIGSFINSSTGASAHVLSVNSKNDSAIAFGVLNAAGANWTHSLHGNGNHIATGTIQGANLVASSGTVDAVGSFTCRPGQNGAAPGYVFSQNWIGTAMEGWVNTTKIGNISYTSDYRAKDNVIDLASMWDTIKALRPVSFKFKAWTPPWELEAQQKRAAEANAAVEPFFGANDPREQWGFIAHEMQEATIMSAATGYKDAENLIQSPNPWTIIAALTKTLQEAMARIEALEAKLP